MATVFYSKNTGQIESAMASPTGLIGPSPYLEIDFKNKLILKSESSSHIESLLSVSRNTGGYVFDNSGIGLSLVPRDKPRIGYDHRSKKYGLIIEPSRYNFLSSIDDSQFTESSTGVFAAYGLGGKLQVMPRQGIEVIGGDGSLESPMFFTNDGNPIDLLKIGNPYHAAIERMIETTSPSVSPYAFRGIKNADVVSTTLDATERTIVVGLVENPVDANTGQSEGRSYLRLEASDGRFLRIRRQRGNGQLNIHQSESRGITIQQPSLSSTIAVSLGEQESSLAINGQLINNIQGFPNGYISCFLGSGLSGFAGNLSGMLTGFALYDRMLSDSDLINASRSWL